MAINLYSKASVDSLLSAKLSISSLTNAAATTLNATAPTTDQVLSFDGTELKWATPAGGNAVWGGITGTLSDQTDLNTVLNLKAPLASPVFTGNPTAPTPATGDNDTSIATTAFVKAQGYLTSSAAASTYYPLTNPSNFVIPNGTTSIQVTGGTVRSIDASDNFTSLDGSALNFGNLGTGVGGLSVTGTGITFADSTVQTTAGIGDAPSDSQTYGRNNGAWTVVSGGGGGSGTLTYSSPYIYDTVTASNINSLDLSSGTLTCGQVIAGNGTVDSSGLTLTASSGAVITFADGTTQSTQPHDLPIGGTTGQVLTKNSATNYDASWATASGGGVNVQTFGSPTTSGTFTWTKPANAKWVEIFLVGGGGSGGSGGRYATTSGRSGGGAGSGAPVLYSRIGADALGATETVVVGAGGVGNAGKTTDNTSGNYGANPSSTTFAGFTSGRGNTGGGGSTTSGASGPGTSTSLNLWYYGISSGSGAAGGTTTGSAPAGISEFIMIPLGGGGGAGAPANVTTNTAGGKGGGYTPTSSTGNTLTIAGGNGGTVAGVQANSGTDATTRLFQGGTGGGGGFYRTGQAGGTGGKGGWPGGGGGGGGASDNGFTSGAGGNGGNGLAVIITYF